MTKPSANLMLQSSHSLTVQPRTAGLTTAPLFQRPDNSLQSSRNHQNICSGSYKAGHCQFPVIRGAFAAADWKTNVCPSDFPLCLVGLTTISALQEFICNAGVSSVPLCLFEVQCYGLMLLLSSRCSGPQHISCCSAGHRPHSRHA